jgi:hypothetical protein
MVTVVKVAIDESAPETVAGSNGVAWVGAIDPVVGTADSPADKEGVKVSDGTAGTDNVEEEGTASSCKVGALATAAGGLGGEIGGAG